MFSLGLATHFSSYPLVCFAALYYYVMYIFLQLASSIRYLLEYVGAEYEETRYQSADKWFSVKFEMGLDFPNLPWLEDGDVKLTQSGAILRYLAEKHGLHGKDIKDRAQQEMLAFECMDFYVAYAKVVYNPDFVSLPEYSAIFTHDMQYFFLNIRHTFYFFTLVVAHALATMHGIF